MITQTSYKNINEKTENWCTQQKYIYTVSNVGSGRLNDTANDSSDPIHHFTSGGAEGEGMHNDAARIKSEWQQSFHARQRWHSESPGFRRAPAAAAWRPVAGRPRSGSFSPASGCRPDCSPETPPACAAGPTGSLKGWGYCPRSSLPSGARAPGSVCPRWLRETCGSEEICVEDRGWHGGSTTDCSAGTYQDSGDCSGSWCLQWWGWAYCRTGTFSPV